MVVLGQSSYAQLTNSGATITLLTNTDLYLDDVDYNALDNVGTIIDDQANSIIHMIDANWDHDNSNNTGLSSKAGTVSFEGTSENNTLGGDFLTSFNNLVIDKTGRSLTLDNVNQDIDGSLTITNGTFDASAAGCGGGSCNFTLVGDFSNSGTFTARTGTATMDGGVNATITSNGSIFYNLIVDRSGETIVDLGDELQVSNTLTLTDDFLRLGANNVTIGGSGSVVGASSSAFIITNGTGYLRQQNIGSGGRTGSITFPVGTSSTNYNPVVIDNSGGTADRFDVKVRAEVLQDGTSGAVITTNSLDLTWDIEEGVVGGSDASITIQWNASDEQAGFDRTQSYISHHNGSEWEYTQSEGAAAGVGPYTRTVTGRNSFSPHSGGSGTELPIELLSFSAALNDKKDVDLNWVTATEINNDYFTVECSKDGRTSFKEILEVDGAGNSNTILRYDAVDEDPLLGISYYRLKQTDYDGSYSYSKIVATDNSTIKRSSNTDISFQLFPNPSNGENLYIRSLTNYSIGEEILLEVLDLSGKLLYSQDIIVDDSGKFITSLYNNRLASGTYMVNVISDTRTGSQLIVVE